MAAVQDVTPQTAAAVGAALTAPRAAAVLDGFLVATYLVRRRAPLPSLCPTAP